MYPLFSAFLYLATAVLVLCGDSARAKELAIERARVQQAEDGPTVASNFRFLPGEAVYLTFRIAGFATVEKEDDKRFVSLTYRVEAVDEAGLALAPASEGKIENEVFAEDREWLPKVSFSFELPMRMAGGQYRLVAKVVDLAGKSTAAAEIPLRVEGPVTPVAKDLGIHEVRFFRQESDREPLRVVAYQPGDPIWVRFVIAGYKLATGNKLDVEYGVTMSDPDGKIIVAQAVAAKDTYAGFYPCRTVPGILNFTLSKDMPKGVYRVVVVARDRIGNQTVERPLEFIVE